MGIIIKNLCKEYFGQKVLDNFSLELPASGTVCLFGPSGCGKTTLLNCLAGLESADFGKIEGVPEKVSYVFQEDRLLPWISAEENIAVVMPKESQGEAAKWLRQIGLAGSEKKLPAELSGGMRQRAALARAMAYNGELYLLDEPFHALDERAKREIMTNLNQTTCGKLKILVTHDRLEAQSFADKIYLLSGPPLHVEKVITPSELAEI